MNLVKISGPEPVLEGLAAIIDVAIVWETSQILDNGDLQVAAYVTDRSVPEIESAGATIEIVFDTGALNDIHADLQTLIDEQDGIA